MNHNFWILLGTISTTLAAFATIGLTVFYQRAKEACDDLRKCRFKKEPNSIITFSKIINNLTYFLLPLMLSLIIIATISWIAWVLLLALLFLSFLTYQRLLGFRDSKDSLLEIHISGISAIVLILSVCLILIVFPLFLKNISKDTTMIIIENMALLSLMLGIFFSVRTMIYFDKIKAIFEIPQEIKLLWNSKLQKMNTTLQNISSNINNIEDKTNIEPVQLSITRLSNQIKLLEGKTKKEKMEYSEIKTGIEEFELIEMLLNSIVKTYFSKGTNAECTNV